MVSILKLFHWQKLLNLKTKNVPPFSYKILKNTVNINNLFHNQKCTCGIIWSISTNRSENITSKINTIIKFLKNFCQIILQVLSDNSSLIILTKCLWRIQSQPKLIYVIVLDSCSCCHYNNKNFQEFKIPFFGICLTHYSPVLPPWKHQKT